MSNVEMRTTAVPTNDAIPAHHGPPSADLESYFDFVMVFKLNENKEESGLAKHCFYSMLGGGTWLALNYFPHTSYILCYV